MTPAFNDWWELAKKLEGKLHTDLSGGLTNFGISQSSKLIPASLIKSLTEDKAKNLAWDNYAKPFERLSDPKQVMLTDTAYNQGPGLASKFQSLVQSKEGVPAINDLVKQRWNHYLSLAKANPDKYEQYTDGWQNRLKQMSDLAKKELPPVD